MSEKTLPVFINYHYTTVHSPNLFHSLLQSANATRELTTNGTQAEWQTVISLSLHCQLDN